jgi:hypothetical protein
MVRAPQGPTAHRDRVQARQWHHRRRGRVVQALAARSIRGSGIKQSYGRCPGVKNTKLLKVTGCGFVGDTEYPALHKFQVGFVSKAKAASTLIAGLNFSGGYVMPAATLTVTGPTMLAPGYCPNSPSCPGAED